MIPFIKKIIQKYIKDSQYKKNVLMLVFGRVIAQALPILLTPLLTRIYTPAEFGVFGVFFTIISIVSMLSNGRYCLSIILPKDDKKAERLFILASFLTVIVTIVFGILLLIFKTQFFDILNTEVLEKYVWILIINILVIGLYENIYYYALRKKAFKILITNMIVQAVILVATRLILGYLGYTEVGLLISYLLGYAVSYVLLIFRLRIPVWNLIKNFKWELYFDLMKEYYKFPVFSLPADTLSMISNYSPNIFLNKIFGAISTGYYNMCDKVLGTPLWLVTSSVGDVFKQEAAEQFRTKGSCFDVYRKTVKVMFLLGIIPFAILFIGSPYVVPFLLGQDWAPVGDYIRILTIMYFIRFVVRSVYPVLYIVRKQNFNPIFQILHLFSILIAFVIGYFTKNLTYCLIAWTTLSSIIYLIILVCSYKFAKDIEYDELKDS